MFPKWYDDLTSIERENFVKKMIIDYEKKQRVKQMVQKEDKVFVENADLESKKKRYIDLVDQYIIILQQILDYFSILGLGGNQGDGLRFVSADRVPRFFDNYPKINYLNQQLIELAQSILKEISVDDPFLKKLKKKDELLQLFLADYEAVFQPHVIEAQGLITVFNRASMNVRKDEVDSRIIDIMDDLSELIGENNNVITFLESTPRSGKGMNIDTSEYQIPFKYM